MTYKIAIAATAALLISSAVPALSNPTATESQQNATTVHLRDMAATPSTTPAPRIGLAPSVPDALRNATTVDGARTASELAAVSPATRIGVGPSATRTQQDASWVNPNG